VVVLLGVEMDVEEVWLERLLPAGLTWVHPATVMHTHAATQNEPGRRRPPSIMLREYARHSWVAGRRELAVSPLPLIG
jgi:hypothetical protein